MNPPLTTVHTPLAKVGEAATTMLMKLIRGQPIDAPTVDLGYRLVLRQSA
jgi:LacI family gluconate utilization system Gnt-I transcriptional repressor